MPRISVFLRKDLEFKVCVAQHDRNSTAYKENVAAFRDVSSAAVTYQEIAAAKAGETNLRGKICISSGSLSEGGYGMLSRYYNVSTGTYVARKQLASVTSWEMRESWEKEVEMMVRVQEDALPNAETKQYSRHLLKIVDVVPEKNIDIEYVPDGSLSHQMTLRPFSRAETLTVMEQLLKALVVLHGRDTPIIHGGLKPDSLPFQHRGSSDEADIHIKVTDFGCFKQRPTNIYEEERDRLYMAPEQFHSSMYMFQDDRLTTYHCDIWAAGVIIFEMIHKFETRPRSSQGIPCWQTVQETIKDTPSDIAAFVARYMVRQNPNQRLSAVECLAKMYVFRNSVELAQASTSDNKHWLECDTNVLQKRQKLN